ncbi:hypothetical protein HK101_010057 [Irineochytrium annulatum]|nr:hypothetical protein HK101_010057 [Irineochytrium annulatum]
MLDILENVMHTLDINFLRLDGTTSVADRQDLIDQFNEDSSIGVFLLTTKAGGLGLNLTSANVVLLYDIDFNPHNDAQAEDRAHRVGQTRDVEVIKLILKGSVEQHMLRLATAKLHLDRRVQQEDGGETSKRDDADDSKAISEEDGPAENPEEAETLMSLLREEWMKDGVDEADGGPSGDAPV